MIKTGEMQVFSFIAICSLLILSISCKKESYFNPDAPIDVKAAPVFNPQLNYGSVTDQDGNTYKTIKIGTQIWMAENLKTTKFSDGTAIPHISDSIVWGTLKTPAYCWYNNSESDYKPSCGALYNWYAIGSGKLCPTGWHVPTNEEWETLFDYLGGKDIAANILKEEGYTHCSDSKADNSSGFTAILGGYRDYKGRFFYNGYISNWWSYSERNSMYSWYIYLYCDYSNVYSYYYTKNYGLSIRCIKD